MNYVVAVLVALHTLFPALAHAAEQAQLKGPLTYTVRDYGVILGISLLGGFVNWYRRVRKGETEMLSFPALVGELAISAFAGLITFWGCAALDVSPLWTAAGAGIAGHAGGAGVEWAERVAKRYFEKKLGVALTAPAPLDHK